MTQQHEPLTDLTDLDRQRLEHGVTLAKRELAKRNERDARQQAATRDSAEQIAAKGAKALAKVGGGVP